MSRRATDPAALDYTTIRRRALSPHEYDQSWCDPFTKAFFVVLAAFVLIYAGRYWGQRENPAYREQEVVCAGTN